MNETININATAQAINTPTIDLNALFTAALTQAIHQATKDLYLRIAALEERINNITTASDERIMEIADDAARMVMAEHTEEYDHDDYDNLVNNIDEKVSDAIDDYDFDAKIKDTIRDMTFNVSVD